MTDDGRPALRERVAEYYTAKLDQHGPTPAGVDWNSEQSQRLRLREVSYLVEHGYSVVDLGCGYGALLDELAASGWTGEYLGVDLSEDMLRSARDLHPDAGTFSGEMPPHASFDVVVASGLFNVKMDIAEADWESYVEDTILEMFACCRRGISFNMLTSYSDEDRKRSDLYYASPSRFFDFVASNCSRLVRLHHDSELYEFTLHVKR